MKLIYAKDTMHLWLIKNGVCLVHGGIIQIANYVEEHDLMDFEDLIFAMQELNKNNHTVANFGITGGFIFSQAA